MQVNARAPVCAVAVCLMGCCLFGSTATLYFAAAEFPDAFATGICGVAANVMPGDIYCCVERTHSCVYTADGHDAEEVETALNNGAIAIIAAADNELEVDVPASVPVIYADDVDELAGRLAAVYYGEQVSLLGEECVWLNAL